MASEVSIPDPLTNRIYQIQCNMDLPNLFYIEHMTQSASRHDLISVPKHNSMNSVKTCSSLMASIALSTKILLKALDAPVAQPGNTKSTFLGVFEVCLARFLEPSSMTLL